MVVSLWGNQIINKNTSMYKQEPNLILKNWDEFFVVREQELKTRNYLQFITILFDYSQQLMFCISKINMAKIVFVIKIVSYVTIVFFTSMILYN
jgi:hypothetical protein